MGIIADPMGKGAGKMRSRAVMAVVVAGAALSGWQPVHAAERDLVIGVEELDYFPVYAWRDRHFAGAASEIFETFAQAKGYHLTYRPLPIKRLYLELLNKGIDIKFPDNPEWAPLTKKDASIAYSQGIIAFIDGVMVPPDRVGAGIETFHTLGTIAGFTPFGWLDRIQAGTVQLKENPRLDQLLRQTLLGRNDGAYVSVAVATHVLSSEGASLVYDPGLPHTQDVYRASSVARPEVVAELNAWLAANAATIKAIKDRYGAENGIRPYRHRGRP
jgi:hypothetical protein